MGSSAGVWGLQVLGVWYGWGRRVSAYEVSGYLEAGFTYGYGHEELRAIVDEIRGGSVEVGP